MKTEFYVGEKASCQWWVFNWKGQRIAGYFGSFEAAMQRLNAITGTHAEHRHCDDCGEGFVTGARDVLCPKCRPIRSNKS